MIIEKELSAISLHITEPEYRQRTQELSYSNLSTYEKVGFNGLDHLFDRKESSSLTFGSAVDCYLTGGVDEFHNTYTVMDINITEGGENVIRQLVNKITNENLGYEKFDDIPKKLVSDVAKESGFWKADKWDARRYNEVVGTGNVADYYDVLMHADKIVITTAIYQDLLNCVKALRESPSTSGYFAENDEFSPVRRYYQLKFAATFDGVGYRNMADLLVCDYEKKVIYPIDLKTSSHAEWDFEKSFTEWQYMIQARLYWRIIKANLEADPYFREFELKDYRFVVVNAKTLTPLTWEFPLTKTAGTLIDDKGNEYRDPFVIGKELRGYLNLRPAVPNGITQNGVNIIKCLRLKEPNA